LGRRCTIKARVRGVVLVGQGGDKADKELGTLEEWKGGGTYRRRCWEDAVKEVKICGIKSRRKVGRVEVINCGSQEAPSKRQRPIADHHSETGGSRDRHGSASSSKWGGHSSVVLGVAALTGWAAVGVVQGSGWRGFIKGIKNKHFSGWSQLRGGMWCAWPHSWGFSPLVIGAEGGG